jgi:ABC-2 type transport system permease protein
VEMLSYPMSVYEEWFRKFFTYVIPMAFINYVPALRLLGRVDELPAPWVGWLSPLACVAVFAVALRVWNWGVRKYQSTGS